MAIKTLKTTDLEINTPVDWHVYDGNGRLLLKKGMQLRSKRQIAKLVSLNAFRRVGANEPEELDVSDTTINTALSPFQQIEQVLDYLERLFKIVIYKPANPKKKLYDKFYELSHGIIQLCEYDLDATIGVIHSDHKHDYTIVHPLHCAILCYCLAIKVGITDRRLNSIICAAITSNMGMYELQSQLLKHQGALSPEQRDDVNKHTMRSAILLKRIGVIDRLWLEIVLQHHEKIDGSGYPRQLKGKKFIREARILGISDRYHAMVAPREYRKGMSPTDALKMIFQERGAEVDKKLGSILIKEMGIYPPGAVVKLTSNEIAIVTRRGEDRTKPLVKSIYAPDGAQYLEPVARDTANKDFKVLGMCHAPLDYTLDPYKLWDYNLM